MRSMNFKHIWWSVQCSPSGVAESWLGFMSQVLPKSSGLPSYAPIIKAALNILFKKTLCVGPSFSFWQYFSLQTFLHQNTTDTHNLLSTCSSTSFWGPQTINFTMGQPSPEFQKQNLYYFYCRTWLPLTNLKGNKDEK